MSTFHLDSPVSRIKGNNKVLILHPYLKKEQIKDAAHMPLTTRSPESRLEEAKGLAAAIDLEVIHTEIIPLAQITPATYMGSGKVKELAETVEQLGITLAIIDTQITPTQQRNLEVGLKCKVIDRTALILEIFGERANTREGHLQVELAAYEYQKSRLVRSWTHLERQRGGGGFLGGPGETQIESDRRAIRNRILKIKGQLEKVVRTRELHRKSRRAIPYKVVSLVGYTNTGKSTLFNRLSNADVLAEDKLFATLDPTMRVLRLPSGQKVILSDTVGFISDLPTELVAAFRATLEEVIEAEIILHVRDISHPETEAQKKDVESVLSSLGLESALPTRLIEVYNKTDCLEGTQASALEERLRGINGAVPISALTGQGCDALLARIEAAMAKQHKEVRVRVPIGDGALLAWIHAHADVLACEQQDNLFYLKLSISPENDGRLKKKLREGHYVVPVPTSKQS